MKKNKSVIPSFKDKKGTSQTKVTPQRTTVGEIKRNVSSAKNKPEPSTSQSSKSVMPKSQPEKKQPVKAVQSVVQMKKESSDAIEENQQITKTYDDEKDENQTQQKSIRVFCRFRPLNKTEVELTNNDIGKNCVKIQGGKTIKMLDQNETTFNFDEVFDYNTEQEVIFEKISRRSLNDVLKGFNATLFCYGQTGSGKTFTMYGLDVQKEIELGIIPRSIIYLFESIADHPDPDVEFEIQYSMLEIYKEQIKDLLNSTGDSLQIKEHPKKGIYVDQLQQICVASYQESMDLLEMGQNHKSIASTKMNACSSRAHTIFIIEIKQRFSDGSEKKGVLNLIDLAGSEKISRTGAEGETLEEAKKINLSLTSLGSVINALTTKKDHIPYRDSKLTRLLQESLGGNFKTSLIVNASLHSSSIEETISTLRFGTRAKSIKTNFKMNMILSPEKMQKMIDDLKQQLRIKDKIIESKGYITGSDFLQVQSEFKNNQQADIDKNKEFENKIQELQKYNEELEAQNMKLEEKNKQFEENQTSGQSGDIQQLNKRISELTEDKDKIQFKLQQLQAKYDLVDKQQAYYQQTIKDLREQLKEADKRGSDFKVEKSKLVDKKIDEYLQEYFQDYHEKNSKQQILPQFIEKNDNFDQKHFFDQTKINIQNLQNLANQINKLFKASKDNSKLVQFLLQTQQYQQCMITENLDFLLKVQNQTHTIEFEKYRLRGDYSFIQEQLIAQLEKVIEKASASQTQMRKRVEKQEQDISQMQKLQNTQVIQQQPDLQVSTTGAQIKRRITKANIGVLDQLRRSSNANNMNSLQSNLAAKVNNQDQGQNTQKSEGSNVQLQHQQNKILILLSELDLEKTKSSKISEAFNQSSKQIKNQDTLIQNFETFQLNKMNSPLIKQQFQDLQNTYEIFNNWMAQFFSLLKLKGIDETQEAKDLKFFLEENDALCDQTIIDFIRMQKNAVGVAKQI